MSEWSESKLSAMADLSMLMDGELGPADAARACTQWSREVDSRANWHTYHLIGDVLRSEDLATNPQHDATFLAALRQRLAQEPVVLEPSATLPALAPAHVAKRRSWTTPIAMSGRLIRDARLDEYLAAHKKFGGSSAPGGPSGFLRNAAADGTAR